VILGKKTVTKNPFIRNILAEQTSFFEYVYMSESVIPQEGGFGVGGKRKWETLGHANRRKAERRRAEKEKELRMGYVEPESMMLSAFAQESFVRTGDQISESTRKDYGLSMVELISALGNINYQCVQQTHGELFRQIRLDEGDSLATVGKKLRELKRLFQLAVERKQLDENPLRHVKVPKVPM
jgi:hypothetical protein